MAKRKATVKQEVSKEIPVIVPEVKTRTIYNKINQKIELNIGGKLYILAPGGSAQIPGNSILSDDVKQYVK